MNRLTRREFAVAAGASAAAVAAPAVAQSKGGRIVVVGGGFGGASAAKYAKMFGGAAVEVTLIEPNKTFYTCPFSNLVLGGLRDIDSIGHGFDAMKKTRRQGCPRHGDRGRPCQENGDAGRRRARSAGTG